MARLASLLTLLLTLTCFTACEKKAASPPTGASIDPDAAKKALADKVAERARLVMSFGGSPSKEDRTKLELLNEEIQKKTAELEPGSDEKKQAMLDGIMEKYHADIWRDLKAQRLAAMGTAARAALMELGMKQAGFRQNDPDGNGLQDYWVADVSGLARLRRGGSGDAIGFVGPSVALADGRPCVALDVEGEFAGRKLVALGRPSAKKGYWLAAVKRYETAEGKEEAYDNGQGANPVHFAICAWPAEYGTTGVMTYLNTEAGVVWEKDTGGKPVDVTPSDPKKDGWSSR